MGDRSFIQIDSQHLETPILLYGHWSGADNLIAVKDVLGRTDRVGDHVYLTAQLFYQFAVVQGRYDGELSFGIDVGHVSEDHWVDAPTVYVNADTGEYSYEGVTYDEFARTPMRM